MKLPSIQKLGYGLKTVVMRFPIQFLLAIFSTIVCWLLLNRIIGIGLAEASLYKMLAICNLTLTLSLSTDLFCEAHQKSSSLKWILRAIAVSICAGLYIILEPSEYLSDVFRLGLLIFAFHLLVSFSPFIGKENLGGFWQYNKTLFIRFLTSSLYAVVLFAGLAIALVAIDGLFSVHIESDYYWRLLVVVGVAFNTIFFLAGVPETFDSPDDDQSYPKGLKIFTQYVLIPLMTIYLAILLVYEIKIIVQWTLPKGLVSTLILGYAVFGILSLLLIYPIKDKEGNAWIKLFSRFFYLMMIPLVILLLLAIGTRVGDYGITESRYILLVLAGWLAFITIYFLISKRQNIKIIPVSLCIIAILATYGPQSAFSVSKSSQISRLRALLKNKDKTATDEKSSIITYLVGSHGLASLQSFTQTDLASLSKRLNAKSDVEGLGNYTLRNTKVDTAFAILKIQRYSDYEVNNVRFLNDNDGLILVGDYDAVMRVKNYEMDSVKQFNGSTFKVLIDPNDYKSNVSVTVDQLETVDFDFKPIFGDAFRKYKNNNSNGNYFDQRYPSQKMELEHQTKKYKLKLIIDKVTVSSEALDKQLIYLMDLEGYLLIKKR